MNLLRLVRPCDVPSCEREGTCEISNREGLLGHYCPECTATIEQVFASVSEMVRKGTPRNVAARWGR